MQIRIIKKRKIHGGNFYILVGKEKCFSGIMGRFSNYDDALDAKRKLMERF